MKNKTFKTCAIAAALAGGVALTASPVLANSIHNEGDFGGSWSRIGPKKSYRHRNYERGYYAPRRYYAPRGYYAPRRYYRGYSYYGPRGYYGPSYYY